MATVFEGSCLRGFNNKGICKPLDDGYYDVVLSVLEYPNSYGAEYDSGSAEEIIERSPIFKRRMKDRLLRGELGHPPQRLCKDYDDYVNRIHTIYEANIALHIRKVWIDRNYILPNGRKIVAIRGEVCPDGPHADVVRRWFENPHANLAFSVRSMATDKIVGGRVRKYFDSIITWDVVNEPGLEFSTKYNSVACESMNIINPTTDVYDRVEVMPSVIDAMSKKVHANTMSGVSCEAAVLQTTEGLERARRRERLFTSKSNRLSKW